MAFSGKFRGADTIKLTVIEDNGETSTPYSKAFTAGPVEMWAEPSNTDDLVAVRIRIEETAGATEGFVPDSVALVVQPKNRTRFPTNGARVSTP